MARHLKPMRSIQASPIGSFLSPIMFLLYINNVPKNILSSLVNIYAAGSTVYACTSKNLGGQCLAGDISSGWDLTAQWRLGIGLEFSLPQKPSRFCMFSSLDEWWHSKRISLLWRSFLDSSSPKWNLFVQSWLTAHSSLFIVSRVKKNIYFVTMNYFPRPQMKRCKPLLNCYFTKNVLIP